MVWVHIIGVCFALSVVSWFAGWLRTKTILAIIKQHREEFELEKELPIGALADEDADDIEELDSEWRSWMTRRFSSKRFVVRLTDLTGLIGSIAVYLSLVCAVGYFGVFALEDGHAAYLWGVPLAWAGVRLCLGFLGLLTHLLTGLPPSGGAQVRRLMERAYSE